MYKNIHKPLPVDISHDDLYISTLHVMGFMENSQFFGEAARQPASKCRQALENKFQLLTRTCAAGLSPAELGSEPGLPLLLLTAACALARPALIPSMFTPSSASRSARFRPPAFVKGQIRQALSPSLQAILDAASRRPAAP